MSLRDQLVKVALEWQNAFGNAPAITSALAEYDAAILVGCSESGYRSQMRKRSVVARGYDFELAGLRYQVKANRPSGRLGSTVTLVGKPRNYEWDFLVWVHYHTDYRVKEVWMWPVSEFREQLGSVSRLSPKHIRLGKQLFGHADES